MTTPEQIAPESPSLEVIAAFVKLSRGMAGWKKATLASVAEVSLSTVERVERGETVSEESLQRLAAALHQSDDAFTAPRVPKTDAEALAAVVEQWAWLGEVTPVEVAPLRGQAQLRAISRTALAIVDHDLDDAEEDVGLLKEWMELLSFVRAEHQELINSNLPRQDNMRRLYSDVLGFVAGVEREHRCVCLVGTYQPETRSRMFKGASVGLISLRSKVKNPAAASRRVLYAPATVDFRDALARAFAEDGD